MPRRASNARPASCRLWLQLFETLRLPGLEFLLSHKLGQSAFEPPPCLRTAPPPSQMLQPQLDGSTALIEHRPAHTCFRYSDQEKSRRDIGRGTISNRRAPAMRRPEPGALRLAAGWSSSSRRDPAPFVKAILLSWDREHPAPRRHSPTAG